MMLIILFGRNSTRTRDRTDNSPKSSADRVKQPEHPRQKILCVYNYYFVLKLFLYSLLDLELS